MLPNEMLEKLTLAEIIQKAQKGNQDAVKTLYVIGWEFAKPGDKQDLDQANKLFSFVGQLGLTEAAWEAMIISRIGAYSRMNLCLWEESLEIISNLQKMASIVINDDDFADSTDKMSGMIHFDIAYQYFHDANYIMAVCMEQLGKKEMALSWLKGVKPDYPNYQKCRIMYGNILFAIAAEKRESLQEAYSVLQLAEPDSPYIPEVTRVLNMSSLGQTEVQYEQIDFVKAVYHLSYIYQVGLPGRMAKDIGHARAILESALSKVSDLECRQSIQKRLNELG